MQDNTPNTIEELHTLAMRCASGDKKEQQRIKYILEHLLPAIALAITSNPTMEPSRAKTKNPSPGSVPGSASGNYETEKLLSVTAPDQATSGSTGTVANGQASVPCTHTHTSCPFITRESLHELILRDYTAIRSRELAAAFPDYTGKSRLILRDIANSDGWFDYAITGQLVTSLELLVPSEDGYYWNIRTAANTGAPASADPLLCELAELGRANRDTILRYTRRKKITFLIGIAVAAAVALIALAAVLSSRPRKLTDSELAVCSEASQQLAANTGLINIMLLTQDWLLGDMTDNNVLSGDPAALSSLSDNASSRLSGIRTDMALYQDDPSCIEELRASFADELPVDIMDELRNEPTLMLDFMENNIGALVSSLGGGSSPAAGTIRSSGSSPGSGTSPGQGTSYVRDSSSSLDDSSAMGISPDQRSSTTQESSSQNSSPAQGSSASQDSPSANVPASAQSSSTSPSTSLNPESSSTQSSSSSSGASQLTGAGIQDTITLEIHERISAYRNYLDAYTLSYYLKYLLVLDSFEELGASDAADELREAITGAGDTFTEYIIRYGIGETDAEALEKELEKAEYGLTTAADELKRCGLLEYGQSAPSTMTHDTADTESVITYDEDRGTASSATDGPAGKNDSTSEINTGSAADTGSGDAAGAGAGSDGTSDSLAADITNAGSFSISDDRKLYTDTLAELILFRDSAGYLYDRTMDEIGKYLDTPDPELLSNARTAIADVITQLEKDIDTTKTLWPESGPDEAFLTILTAEGITATEYNIYTGSMSTTLAEYINELIIMDYYAELMENGGYDFILENFDFTYKIHLNYRTYLKQYDSLYTNYWFADWDEAALAYVDNKILSRLTSLELTLSDWDNSRDSIETRANAILDKLAEQEAALSEHIGRQTEELYSMEHLTTQPDT